MDTFIEIIGIFFVCLIISVAVFFTGYIICEIVGKEDAKNIASVETIINNEKVTLTNIEIIYCGDTSEIHTKDSKVYKVKEFKVNYIK